MRALVVAAVLALSLAACDGDDTQGPPMTVQPDGQVDSDIVRVGGTGGADGQDATPAKPVPSTCTGFITTFIGGDPVIRSMTTIGGTDYVCYACVGVDQLSPPNFGCFAQSGGKQVLCVFDYQQDAAGCH